jgi:hypothetical protein
MSVDMEATFGDLMDFMSPYLGEIVPSGIVNEDIRDAMHDLNMHFGTLDLTAKDRLRLLVTWLRDPSQEDEVTWFDYLNSEA